MGSGPCPILPPRPVAGSIIYNTRGQVTGQATTRGDTTTFSNEKGQVTGRAERRGSTTNFFNEKGQMIGSSRGR